MPCLHQLLRQLIASAVMSLALASALASTVQPAHAVNDTPLQEPPRMAIPAEYKRFLERGRQVHLSRQEITDLLSEFEGALKEIYGQLGHNLAPVINKETITDDDKQVIVTSTQKAGNLVTLATAKVLQPFHFSAADVARMMPHYRYFSKSVKLSIKKAYPDTDKDLRDEIFMSQPLPFLYFMTGLSRQAGIYIDIAPEKRVIANDFLLNFPAYYISRYSSEKKISLSEDIRHFMSKDTLRDVTYKLYDLKKNKFSLIYLKSSSAYTLDGAAGNSLMYGSNDPFDEQGGILIYEDNIRYSTRKLSDKWRKHLQDSVEIHEVMHALHRSKSPDCWNFADRRSLAINLDEAQAETATLGVLASTQDESLPYAMTIRLTTGWSRPPHLVYDDFYDGILKKVLQRKFTVLQAEANALPAFDARQLPLFFHIAEQATHSVDAQGKTAFVLGTLKIAGKEAAIVADIADLDKITKMDLVFDATPQDVLEQVPAALEKVAELEAKVCKKND